MTDTVEPSRSRLLVITADPSRPSDGNDATRDLIDSLVAQARFAQITVRLIERPWSAALVAAWRRAGLELDVGPLDPSASPDGDWGRYSHVLLTWSGARSCARAWVDRHQPQAARILYLPRLAGPGPAGPGCELVDDGGEPGPELERAALGQVLYQQASWAGAIWCEERVDAEFLRAWVPGTDIRMVPTEIEPGPDRRTWAARAGVVVPATGGADIGTGADDAAVGALEGIVADLRRADPRLTCTVISDGPSARLRQRAAWAGASIAGTAELAATVAAARLVICLHRVGTGQRSAMAESLRAGTPFVATATALGGIDLDATGAEGGGLIVDPGDRGAALRRARALLGDEKAWSSAVAGADRLTRSRYSQNQRIRCVAAALAELGVTSGRPVIRPPARRRWPRSTWAPRAKDDPGLRPPGLGSPPPLDRPGPDSPDEAYRLWAERHGPTPEVLAALADELRDLGPGPSFSILMPVYNTDPGLLRAAVDSFRGQIYDRWELCLGNDGSDRPDTLQILEEIRSDPRVTVVDGPTGGGISAATNAALTVAGGDYVAFVDHDDILKPHALAQMARWIIRDPGLDVVYSDEDKLDADGQLRDVHLKPDYSPDQLLSQNYISHLTVARRGLVESVGGLRSEFDGSQDYDLLLRLVEATERIGHVPEPLYSWRAVPGSFAADIDSKPYAIRAAARALSETLARRGYCGSVETISDVGRYRVRFPLPGRPKVTIVIPTRDRVDLLRRCVDSIVARSTYDHYEIVVVDNQSTDPDTLGYLAGGPWRVIRYPHPFNYARLTNLAAGLLETDALLFLNNDTEVITPGWMEAMLEHAMRPEVGAVGARLFFADGTPQHEGISVGTWGDWANNVDHRGYFSRGEMVRNSSAVTGACCMVRPSAYHHVGGADPGLRVAYNDVDLCLRLRSAGYEIVYTPHAELYHHEGSSRRDYQHHEDAPRFRDRWNPRAVLDPYYSPVFSDAVPFRIEP